MLRGRAEKEQDRGGQCDEGIGASWEERKSETARGYKTGTYLEEEVCKDGVEEDEPEEPAFRAHKASDQRDDDSAGRRKQVEQVEQGSTSGRGLRGRDRQSAAVRIKERPSQDSPDKLVAFVSDQVHHCALLSDSEQVAPKFNAQELEEE